MHRTMVAIYHSHDSYPGYGTMVYRLGSSSLSVLSEPKLSLSESIPLRACCQQHEQEHATFARERGRGRRRRGGEARDNGETITHSTVLCSVLLCSPQINNTRKCGKEKAEREDGGAPCRTVVQKRNEQARREP